MTEKEIRRAIYPFIAIFGHLDMVELGKIIPKYLNLDKEDLKPALSRRGETKFRQKLRNLISHKNKSEIDYGYIIDKSVKPSSFILKSAYGQNNEISENIKHLKSLEIGSFLQLPVIEVFSENDFDVIDSVVDMEKEKISKICPGAEQQVINLAREYPKFSANFGFNILSLNENLEPIFILARPIDENRKTILSEREVCFLTTRKNQGCSYWYKVDNNRIEKVAL